MIEVGDYLFCLNPDPTYYGRIFKVVRNSEYLIKIKTLLTDGTIIDDESSFISSEKVYSSQCSWPFPRHCTTLEIMRAKLLGL